VASSAGSALHQRSVHAHRDGEFISAELHRSKMPADMKEGMEKFVTSKAEVIDWLRRSLEGVKTAYTTAKPKDLDAR
jgi:hypothetical protein